MSKLLAVFAAASLVVTGCASSSTAEKKDSTPAKAETAHGDIEVLEWPAAEKAMAAGAVLIDARSPSAYEKGHIAGAINVPCKDDAAYAAKLPADKSTHLIWYCGGPACSASNAGAKSAQKMGYTKLAEYRGGYPAWAKLQGIEAKPFERPAVPGVAIMTWADVAAAMEQGAVLVDARNAEAYAKGHIAGAINVPYKDDAAYASLPADKETLVITYCGGPQCSASSRCATTAQSKGYNKVAEYRGGYPEWKDAQPAGE